MTSRRRLLWASPIVAVIVLVVGVGRLRPAPPTLSRSALLIGVVQRGTMRREVRAPGTLVPEHVRIVAATTAGRVEQLPVRPGDSVVATTVIVELSNPDVQLQALQAAQAVREADAAVANLRSSLLQQELAQQTNVASIRTQYQNARRAVTVQERLQQQDLTSSIELESARDAATEFSTRMEIESRRLDELRRASADEIRLAGESAAGLRAIAREQRERVEAMRVVAGERGILQTLGSPSLEVGQWVNSGFELARVARPGRLKAVLRVPEVAAREVALGQRVAIDTRGAVVPGHVSRADPSAQFGTVTVEVTLDSALTATRSDQSVDGTIEIERLPDVVHVARPASASRPGTLSLFRIEPNTGYASRLQVDLGRLSDATAEVVRGLAVGDSVILSEVAVPDDVVRVRVH